MFWCIGSCRTCGLVQLVQRPASRAAAPAGCGPSTQSRQKKLTGEASCAENANAALRVAPGTGADAAVSAARGATVSTAKMRESWTVNPGQAGTITHSNEYVSPNTWTYFRRPDQNVKDNCVPLTVHD